jgi:hypothetical protein
MARRTSFARAMIASQSATVLASGFDRQMLAGVMAAIAPPDGRGGVEDHELDRRISEQGNDVDIGNAIVGGELGAREPPATATAAPSASGRSPGRPMKPADDAHLTQPCAPEQRTGRCALRAHRSRQW